MQYDDLYRLTQIDHQYAGGTDDWADPFDAEAEDSTRAQPMPRADFGGAKRPLRQTFRYDEVGNSVETDDDTHAFFDRSLGTIENGTPTNGPYQLRSANNAGKPGGRNGQLSAHYDPAGNLTWLAVERAGKCVGSVGCPVLHFRYEWDGAGGSSAGARPVAVVDKGVSRAGRPAGVDLCGVGPADGRAGAAPSWTPVRS